MPRKEDIEPTGAAKVLKGLGAEMAAAVRKRAEAFLAEAADPKAINQDLRTIAAIARAAVAVQAMQAAEDKADARAVQAHANRAAARVHALNPNPDEGDETDMNEEDPRLEDPKLMAAADKELERRLDALALEIKAERLPRKPAKRAPHCGVGQLDAAKPPHPAPAH